MKIEELKNKAEADIADLIAKKNHRDQKKDRQRSR